MAAPVDTWRRGDGIVIRVVDAEDPLMSDVAELCYHALHRPFGVSRQAAWNENDPASTHLAALDGDTLAGYARLIAEGGGGHIRQVVVAHAYRRRGIAADLVSCALARARTAGLTFAFLNARANAVGLYERLGFAVVGAPFRMGRTYLPHVRMEMRL